MGLPEVSVYGAVFVAAVMIIRAMAMNYLPKKTFLILWEMVILRLMIPITIPSVFSVYTFLGRSINRPPLLKAEMDNMTSTISHTLSQEHFWIEQSIESADVNSLSVSAWSVIWCIGMLFFAVFFTVSYLRCRMEFRTALPVKNTYVEQWLKERPLKRQISIKQSDRISTPLTYGIFHPVILMPKKTDWENVNHLQYIFSHEYVHICHFDTVKKLAAVLVFCLHWFNPFVWIMYILFNRDIELACDESVVRQFGEKSKSAYSRMLIHMEAKRSGLLPFCSNFSKNAIEERITVLMNTKQTTPARLIFACLTVIVTVSLFATSAIASTDSSLDGMLAVNVLQTGTLETDILLTNTKDIVSDKKSPMSITHESADILYYEDGSPYIHDILTNNTDKTITETQYCMLAYNEEGFPLKLVWNFLDSSAENSFENIVRSRENLLSNQTEEYHGGWSLYDGEIMKDFPKVGNGEPNQVAYALICLKEVVFEDGAIWNNPNYENWFRAYAGKEVTIEELQNYYPYEYRIELN